MTPLFCESSVTQVSVQHAETLDDSDWARTSDLYPVKVALSQLSYGIMICMCCWVCCCLSDIYNYISWLSVRQHFFYQKQKKGAALNWRHPFRL